MNIHRFMFGNISARIGEIIEACTHEENLKSLFGCILKKFEIEIVWLCQLESLDDVIQTLVEYKHKSTALHSKTLVREG